MMEQDRAAIMQGIDEQLKKGKSRRKIVNDMKDKWREYWGECEGKLFVEVTNEKRKKGAILESVNNLWMQYLQFKPQLDQDPEARKMFNELRFMAGLAPVDFTNSPPAQQQTQANAQPMEGEDKEQLAQSARSQSIG
jgi:hypothetical protein